MRKLLGSLFQLIGPWNEKDFLKNSVLGSGKNSFTSPRVLLLVILMLSHMY